MYDNRGNFKPVSCCTAITGGLACKSWCSSSISAFLVPVEEVLLEVLSGNARLKGL